MDVDQLMIIQRFLEIHEKEGPEAACKWAAAEEAKLNKPDLKVVSPSS